MNFKIVKRSDGKSSVAKVAYHNRARLEDTRTGQVYDYSHRQDLAFHTILAPASAPAELVADSGTLWSHIENLEKRKDSQVCRSFDISLHNELTEQENIDLFLSFAKKSFIDKGMIADLAFHRGTNGDNFHVHGALSLREISASGFGKKNRDWNEHSLVEEWRKDWASMSNQALKAAGHKVRIDNRSLKAQQQEAIRKAEATTDPEVKARLVARAVRLDRAPMTRISAKSWHTNKSKELRKDETKTRDLQMVEARQFLKDFKTIEPAQVEPEKIAPVEPQKPNVTRSKTRVKKSPKKDLFWNKFKKKLKSRWKSATYIIKNAFNNSNKNNDLDDYDDPMESMAGFLDKNPDIARTPSESSYKPHSEDLDRKPSKDLTNEPEPAHNHSYQPDPEYKPRKLKR